MSDYESFALSYPLIRHPIADEAMTIKMMYICLLRHYRKKYLQNDAASEARLDRFADDLLGEISVDSPDAAIAFKEIMRTRFRPFHFYSYRYIFLFDCIFMLAPSNKNLAYTICNEIKSLVKQKYHKYFDNVVQAMYNVSASLPVQSLISEDLLKCWHSTQQHLSSAEKTAVFTATMSAGKSTLINAIIGQELSYTKKAACTSTIIELYSSPLYHTKYNIVFENEIHANLTPQSVRDFTKSLKRPCCIIGYFATQADNIRLNIFDTPGVDSSRNPEHQKITRDALQNMSYDKIVYVIPVETYGSDDDFKHLQFIKNHIPYKSILFAVNMMDTCDLEDDNLSEIVQNVRVHLESIGFERPDVCPISARGGLLFKQALSGCTLSSNDTKELLAFYSKYTDSEYDLSQFYSETVSPMPSHTEYKFAHISREDLQQAYSRTGLPQFEAKLLL